MAKHPVSALSDSLKAQGFDVTRGMTAGGSSMLYVCGVAVEVWDDGSFIKVDGRETALSDVASAILLALPASETKTRKTKIVLETESLPGYKGIQMTVQIRFASGNTCTLKNEEGPVIFKNENLARKAAEYLITYPGTPAISYTIFNQAGKALN